MTLRWWLDRVSHQIHVTKLISGRHCSSQLTLSQAFQKATFWNCSDAAPTAIYIPTGGMNLSASE